MDILTGSHERSVATVELTGRLDALEAGRLRATIAEMMAEDRHRLAVDLSGVDFVDSAGLAALVKGLKDTRQAGGDLRLVSPAAPDALRVFELTKFDKVFVMAPDLETLLADW